MEKNPVEEAVRQAREQLAAEFRAHAEELQKLEQSVQELRSRHQQLEELLHNRLDQLAKVEIRASSAAGGAAASPMLEQVLAGVRDLMTATLPEQVSEVLTQEGEKLGVRAAVFELRGKAAWGASARGFAGLSDKGFRGLVVPISQASPFRTCYETAGHVDADAGMLKKNRNILEKLKPAAEDPILLLPVRSAGSVSAIFYADAGGTGRPLPVDALKILSEFAGAQLDRLMAFSGGMPSPVEVPVEEAEEVTEAVAEEAESAVEVETVEVEPVSAEEPVTAVSEPAMAAEAPAFVGPAGAAEAPAEALPVPGATVPVEGAPAPSAAAAAPGELDVSQLSEEEQKGHRDAKRFAKLLVSEIELYNKAKVQDGRKNCDLYKRLKSDIDRSRQTYEKRFGKTIGKQHDYFHDEMVRILAGSDSSLLGPDYPGPTV